MANRNPSSSNSRGGSEYSKTGAIKKEVKQEFDIGRREVKREREDEFRVKSEAKDEYDDQDIKFKFDSDGVKQEFGHNGPKFGSRTDYGASNFRASARKSQKDTFMCLVCNVELNSMETRLTHAKGRRHIENCERRGSNMPETIVPIRNPSPIRRKIVEDLTTKLMKSKVKAVGLQFVKKYIPVSFAKDMEPYYECETCSTLGDANALFNHLCGKGHKEKVLGFGRQMAALRMDDDKARDLIQTIEGDVLYPWPPGKAPWSLEQGGNGIPPAGARGRFGSTTTTGPFELPSIKSMGPITSENQVYFTDLLKAVNNRVMEHFDTNFSDDDDLALLDTREHVKRFCDLINKKAEDRVKSEKPEPNP